MNYNIADENPTWVANRVRQFVAKDPSPLGAVDLSWFKDAVTLKVGYYGTLGNAALAGLAV